MEINSPTYLIAELTGDAVPLVRTMRERFNPDNVGWPADITIAGSSGVGTIKEGQHVNDVVKHLTPIVEELWFTKIEFQSIGRFPNTGIYYLNPMCQSFDRMHRAVVRSEVAFNDSPWPYNPHCTLRWLDDDNAECRELFDSVALPMNTSIDCFSLYQPHVSGGFRLHKFEH